MTWEMYEQETIVNMSRGESTVRIYSAVPKHIARMRRNASFTVVKTEMIDGHEVVEFEIPESDWNPVSGAKRKRTLSPEQRAEMGARLKKARENAS